MVMPEPEMHDIETSEHGYQPAPPNDVLDQLFGGVHSEFGFINSLGAAIGQPEKLCPTAL